METPICDFVYRYIESGMLRLHMPGHKGMLPFSGVDAAYDITEIAGADALYEASGIIGESERNAGALFGADTYYSTEGSSQCIRAMLYLALLHAAARGEDRPVVLAGRNAHSAFLSAAALLDFRIDWLYDSGKTGAQRYLSCVVGADDVEKHLTLLGARAAAVYLTSPDYLGVLSDIPAIAEVCRRHGVPLLVDNAHGAYLKFLPTARHPMDLGADLCCDSAHKTLPALTGAAYLHISAAAPEAFRKNAKQALALFGSTSPSYLILQSLDALNRLLSEGYRETLAAFAEKTAALKAALLSRGFALYGDEPLKLTLLPAARGLRGDEAAEWLRGRGIECEFADPDFLVMMLTPALGDAGLSRLFEALTEMPKKAPRTETPPRMPKRRPAPMSPRDALFAQRETVPAAESAGRILAVPTVGCPPAVPIVVSGERIDTDAVRCFAYYGIDFCTVVRERENTPL